MTQIRGYNGYLEIRDVFGSLILAEPMRVLDIQINRESQQYLEDFRGHRLALPRRNDGSVHVRLLGTEGQLRRIYPNFEVENPARIERHEVFVSQRPNAASYNRFHNAFLQSLNVLPPGEGVHPDYFEIDASWRYQSEESVLEVPVELRPEPQEYIQEFTVYETIGTLAPDRLRGVRANVMIVDEAWDHPATNTIAVTKRPAEMMDWRQFGF